MYDTLKRARQQIYDLIDDYGQAKVADCVPKVGDCIRTKVGISGRIQKLNWDDLGTFHRGKCTAYCNPWCGNGTLYLLIGNASDGPTLIAICKTFEHARNSIPTSPIPDFVDFTETYTQAVETHKNRQQTLAQQYAALGMSDAELYKTYGRYAEPYYALGLTCEQVRWYQRDLNEALYTWMQAVATAEVGKPITLPTGEIVCIQKIENLRLFISKM